MTFEKESSLGDMGDLKLENKTYKLKVKCSIACYIL